MDFFKETHTENLCNFMKINHNYSLLVSVNLSRKIRRKLEKRGYQLPNRRSDGFATLGIRIFVPYSNKTKYYSLNPNKSH